MNTKKSHKSKKKLRPYQISKRKGKKSNAELKEWKHLLEDDDVRTHKQMIKDVISYTEHVDGKIQRQRKAEKYRFKKSALLTKKTKSINKSDQLMLSSINAKLALVDKFYMSNY